MNVRLILLMTVEERIIECGMLNPSKHHTRLVLPPILLEN